jgi:predicted dehydrogenase
MSRLSSVRKLLAYVRLYGPGRTLAKVAGRSRIALRLPRWSRREADIAMIGCGQFGFATIGYFINTAFGPRFRWCYDVAEAARQSFARHYRVPNCPDAPLGWNEDPAVRFVYIASNHASHSDYAAAALRAGKTVYTEKPVAVSFDQLVSLDAAQRATDGTLFAGYNRPFSAAIRRLRQISGGQSGGMTLSCFVSGHQIAPTHWYRDPAEGTRICGNAGHWIDLFMHMCHWRAELPRHFQLRLASASPTEPDDNFALTITSDQSDIFSLLLSARSEPFEGINETVNFQQGPTIAKIDDFRRMEVWRGDSRKIFRYWPKDVGHRRAILQPFAPAAERSWDEVVRSTILTLTVMEMVQGRQPERNIDLLSALAAIRSPKGLTQQ